VRVGPDRRICRKPNELWSEKIFKNSSGKYIQLRPRRTSTRENTLRPPEEYSSRRKNARRPLGMFLGREEHSSSARNTPRW
jgi:hypothetical protein